MDEQNPQHLMTWHGRKARGPGFGVLSSWVTDLPDNNVCFVSGNQNWLVTPEPVMCCPSIVSGKDILCPWDIICPEDIMSLGHNICPKGQMLPWFTGERTQAEQKSSTPLGCWRQFLLHCLICYLPNRKLIHWLLKNLIYSFSKKKKWTWGRT